jgi:hypothetical protein
MTVIKNSGKVIDFTVITGTGGGTGGGTCDCDIEYDRLTGTPVAVGGAPVGTTFNGTLQDALDKILYPYQAPAFTAFSISGAQTFEVGDTMEGGNYTFSWSTSNSANVKPNSIVCNGVTGLDNDGSDVQMLSSFSSSTVLSKVFTITGTNTKDATFTRNTSVNWALRRYFGVSASTELDDDAIKALSSEFSANRVKSVTYDCTGGNYFYFAYPTSFGDLNNTKVNNIAWNDWVLVKRTFVNNFGVDIEFNIYRSNNRLNGSAVPVVWG